jgi:hypothetical protein
MLRFMDHVISLMAGGVSVPVAANNRVIFVGDSRTANATENSTTAYPQRLAARGYPAWAQLFSGFAMRCVGNYGINTDTIEGVTTRLTAAGISGGTAPSDPRRGWINVYDPGLTAGVAVLLIGVNNAADVISVAGPKYDAAIKGLIDAGRVVVLCNELPNNDGGVSGTNNLARRAYLDGWPGTSSGMSAAEKASYGAKVVKVNTYDEIAVSPSSTASKAGYYPAGDLLHPGTYGNYFLGRKIAEALTQIAQASGFQARTALPSVEADSVLNNCMLTGSVAVPAANSEAAGAGGANMNGLGGAGVSGNLPTGWTFSRSGNLQTLLNGTQNAGHSLTVTLSKTVDADGFDAVRLQISGQVGTTSDRFTLSLVNVAYKSTLTNINGLGSSLADGDTVGSVCKLTVADGHTGLFGVTTAVGCSAPGFTDSGSNFLSGSIAANGQQMDGLQLGTRVHYCEGRTLPTGFAAAAGTKTLTQQLALYLCGGVPVQADITVSRFAYTKNN